MLCRDHHNMHGVSVEQVVKQYPVVACESSFLRLQQKLRVPPSVQAEPCISTTFQVGEPHVAPDTPAATLHNCLEMWGGNATKLLGASGDCNDLLCAEEEVVRDQVQKWVSMTKWSEGLHLCRGECLALVFVMYVGTRH